MRRRESEEGRAWARALLRRGLAPLAGCTKLRYLDVSGSDVTAKGIRATFGDRKNFSEMRFVGPFGRKTGAELRSGQGSAPPLRRH